MMNHKDKRAARVAIFEDTMAWLRADPALKAAAEKAAANTILLDEDAAGHPNVLQGQPRITVTRERTLECAARLHREDPARKIARAIADARQTTEVLICLSAESRAAVDDTTERAGAAGGTVDPGPKQDYGFMYGRSFEDPDGHHWEVMWMDPAAAASEGPPTADA